MTIQALLRKSFVYRLYPTMAQAAAMEFHLAEGARLYNAALAERKAAWRLQRKSIGFYHQSAQLKDIRAAGDLGIANQAAATDVLKRVDRAFEAFFRRVKAGQRPGFPRFRAASRFDSLTFRVPKTGKPDGVKLTAENRVRFQGIGEVRFKRHRPIQGHVKTITFARRAGRWFLVVSVAVEPSPLPASDAAVGLDMGLTGFATLSDGTAIDNPRHFRKNERQLRRANRTVHRRKRGSSSQRRARRAVAKVHAAIGNRRRDFHHKAARRLVNAYGRISVEDLNVKGLTRGHVAKSVHDAGWSAFIDTLMHKAAEAGRELVKVDARGTSQACLCGCEVRKTLADRWHDCPDCGLSLPRDHVSALLIDRLGRSRHASSTARAVLA
jgi:putative transposase